MTHPQSGEGDIGEGVCWIFHSFTIKLTPPSFMPIIQKKLKIKVSSNNKTRGEIENQRYSPP